MEKYRVCENKYGYYKIQRQQKEIKILGITFRKEWRDSCFDLFSNTLKVFHTIDEAQHQIANFITNDKKENNNWKCV